jgi:hypothetical protein
MRRLLLSMRKTLAAPSRNPRTAVVLGRLLAAAFLICFGTGLYSHFLQDPLPWMQFTTQPANLYQLTQGVHITAGIACFPLLAGKLYAVYSNLFQTPPVRSVWHLLERASITLFVSASILQIVTGLINTYQWYPWPFSFRHVHFALSFVIIGSLAVHIASKLPIITRYWRKRDSYDTDGELRLDREDEAPTAAEIHEEPQPSNALAARAGGVTGRIFDWIDETPPREPRVSRRGFFVTIGVAAASVVALTAGQSFRVLDATNVFAARKAGLGPNSLPINRTAKAAQVLESAVSPDWRLTVRRGDVVRSFSHDELSSLPQREVELPIACVEGWSQTASWRGIRLSELMATVGVQPHEDLKLTSLETKGHYRITSMGSEYVQDPTTLVALRLNGDVLDIDHGYPARMIAPGRPGVLQTKWLSTIEVV